MSPLGRDETLSLLAKHGLEARKVLGQNFVVDVQVIERIVQLAEVGPTTNVLEVGPGLGALTSVLARTAARVIALEKDESLVPIVRGAVESRQGPDTTNVSVIAGDALKADWAQLLGSDSEWVLVANLPYNVAVPIVMSVLQSAPMVTRGLVMVQQEVAERLAAPPGGRTIGVPSIEMAWYASAQMRDTVPPEVFHPVPNVASALLEFHRREQPSSQVTAAEMMSLVACAYRKRRKMLRSSLSGMIDVGLIEAAGIEPTARPETLSLSDWVRLAEARNRAGVDDATDDVAPEVLEP